MKYLIYIISILLFSCSKKICKSKIYVLDDTLNSSYIVSKDVKNYIPNVSDIYELNSLVEKDISNENEFYSKKDNVKLRKAKFYQYSGLINNEKDTIIVLCVIYKTNSNKYDFKRNNYIWFDDNPFSKKNRVYFVIEYNKTKKKKPKILQSGKEPNIYR